MPPPLVLVAPFRSSVFLTLRRTHPLPFPYHCIEANPEHTSIVQLVVVDHSSIQADNQIGTHARYERVCKGPHIARTAGVCRGKPTRTRVSGRLHVWCTDVRAQTPTRHTVPTPDMDQTR